MWKYLSDSTGGTIAPVIAINEARDGDTSGPTLNIATTHTLLGEYTSKSLVEEYQFQQQRVCRCRTNVEWQLNGLERKGP